MIQLMTLLNGIGKLLLDMIPEIVGSTIGVLGAIYLFNRQTKQDKEEEGLNVRTEQEEVLRYSSILISNVISTYKKESEELKIYADDIKQQPYLNLTHVKAFATNDINRLVNILNGKDYLHTYLLHLGNNQNSLEEFGLISKCIDYLEISRKQIEEIGNMAAKNDYERRINYNRLVIENINKIKDFAYDKVLNRMDILEILIPFNIVYGDDSSLTIDQHMKMAVLPVISLLQQSYHSHEGAKKVEFELIQAVTIANHVLHNNIKYSQDIQELRKDLEITVNKLSSSSKRLEEYTRDNKL